MNKIKILGIGMTFVMGLVFLASASSVSAYESPNILVGQDLTLGSTGQSVVVLQGLMSELGYLNVPAGIPFGYYGTLTKNAVARYQAGMNVAPAVGYYGPVTKISMHSDFLSHGWLTLLGW
jgi:peptidoglycan hydrolase-like protein with peptidoglycan-binding domain